jgi:hypothetical protein
MILAFTLCYVTLHAPINKEWQPSFNRAVSVKHLHSLATARMCGLISKQSDVLWDGQQPSLEDLRRLKCSFSC